MSEWKVDPDNPRKVLVYDGTETRVAGYVDREELAQFIVESTKQLADAVRERDEAREAAFAALNVVQFANEAASCTCETDTCPWIVKFREARKALAAIRGREGK